VINEVLADPLGVDSNCDGVLDSLQDEFVELVNVGPGTLDLTGAVLADALADRFTFPALVLGAGDAVVVFTGGTPTFDGTAPDAWCGALPAGVSTLTGGALNLNNGGDTITLRDAGGTTLATMTYGAEGGAETALVLDPELTGSNYVLHDTVSTEVCSPGTRADGTAL
jgi:hypothetical protein